MFDWTALWTYVSKTIKANARASSFVSSAKYTWLVKTCSTNLNNQSKCSNQGNPKGNPKETHFSKFSNLIETTFSNLETSRMHYIHLDYYGTVTVGNWKCF